VTRAGKRATIAALATVALVFSHSWRVPLLAAAEKSESEPLRRAFEITVDLRPGTDSAGAPPALGAGDFTVSLGGNAVAVQEARPIAAGEWQILVYVDGLVAKHDELERAAAALEAAKARLAALGPVTVLVADTLVEPWVEDTTDLDELQSAFAELSEATFEPPSSRGGSFVASRRALLLEQIGRRSWGRGARALLVIGDVNAERSAGPSPVGAGGAGAAKSAGAGSSAGSGGVEDPARRGALATAIAALGWVAMPLYVAAGDGIAISPLAEETGGEAVLDAGEVDAAIGRLSARHLLRIGAPVGDAAIVPMSVEAPPGWTARAPRWLATSTPEFVLRARIEALLAEEGGGELDVSASAALDSDAAGAPELAVEVLAEAPPGGGGRARRFSGTSSRIRASFVLARLEEEPIVVHYGGTGASLDGAGAWLLQARLEVPEDLDGVAVLVEDVTTGEWGAALAEIDGEEIEVSSSDRVATEVADLRPKSSPATVAAAKAAPPPLVRLVPPRVHELVGVQTFRAMALNAFIDRVVFLLDGQQVDEDRDDPFAGRIDLGRELRQHEVKAVAYDRAGRELGRDAVTVNRPRAAFGVHIVELKGVVEGAQGDGTLARGPVNATSTGPIEVVADVTAPPRQRIVRVEVYWNETLAATLNGPPWEALLGPRQSSGGDYVRVVAHLDDGQMLEDVRLVGATGSVERVEVNLVEIFTVVLDQEGAPLHDLKREEVSVRLAGKPIELDRFGVAEDLPLDVGLVIDTSQSMEVLMDDTRNAAIRFIADLVRPTDRSFLVDFDTKPRLAHPMTKNMMELVKAMGTLRADGNTALFDSIVFAILHFEEGEDRRAIVLLTDGDDYKSRFSARQAGLQARAAGVPVYLVSLAGLDWLTPAMKKDDLELIAKQTGGRVFYVSAAPELDAAYARIGDELRSQYVLAFATEKPLSESELSKLEVSVSRPGAAVRAVVSGRSIQTR
jgi:Ca-activated chloride channel family protein